MKSTGLFSLGLKDIGKGFITAIITAIITGLYTSLSAVPPHFPNGADFKAMGLMALAAGVSYLMKNFLTNNKDQLLTKDVPNP